MINNNQIQTALFDILASSALGLPIAWPGMNFTPPSSGQWLEVSLFPNEPTENGISDISSVMPRGNFQVAVADRPGAGVVTMTKTANDVQALYARGTVLVDPVRIQRMPYQMQMVKMDDRMMIPVTMPYSA